MPNKTALPKRVTSTEELLTALRGLSRFSRAVYEVLMNNLYAEPGFSDVTASVLAMQFQCTLDIMSKTLDTLNALGLIYTEEWVTFDNPKKTFIHSYEHDDEITR